MEVAYRAKAPLKRFDPIKQRLQIRRFQSIFTVKMLHYQLAVQPHFYLPSTQGTGVIECEYETVVFSLGRGHFPQVFAASIKFAIEAFLPIQEEGPACALPCSGPLRLISIGDNAAGIGHNDELIYSHQDNTTSGLSSKSSENDEA
jgi:hypothetical protein